jgi:hypothetical protein
VYRKVEPDAKLKIDISLAYYHRRLAPDLLALAFSIEGVRAELEAKGHPSAPRLKELLNRLTEEKILLEEMTSSKEGKPHRHCGSNVFWSALLASRAGSQKRTTGQREAIPADLSVTSASWKAGSRRQSRLPSRE